jgi:hypothetical protein
MDQAVNEAGGALRCVELKVCERCGGLWLRPGGSAWVYCRPCKGKVDELPGIRLKQIKHARVRKAKRGRPRRERVQ